MKFIPLNKKNGGCPICGQDGGSCRRSSIDLNFIQCHTFADAKKLEKINGFVCTKESGGGHTASFKPDNTAEWSKERKLEWEARKARRHQEAAEEKQQMISKLLSIEERDRGYREIASRLDLNQRHISSLAGRGLTQQEIDFAYHQGWLRSWQPGFEVKSVSPYLAGVSPGFTRTLLGVLGISVTATDGEGHVVGHQIASDDREKFGKYIWLSSNSKGGNSPHLPNAELPLFIWRHPEAAEITETWLVEGSLKSLIVALKAWTDWGHPNVQIVGAAGANFVGSSETFKKALSAATSKKVKLFPDAGSTSNQHIASQYEKISKLVQELGYHIQFGWWQQIDKSFPDIDELKIEEYSTIRYLSVSEFEAICVKWGGLQVQVQVTNDVVVLDYQERVAQAQQKLHTLSYPVDLVCDPNKKYLPDLVGRIPTKGLVALHSPKGSGKSHQIKLIKQHCCGYWEDKIISPEVPNLPQEQLEVLGLTKAKLENQVSLEPKIERIRHKGLGMSFLSINARIALGRQQAIRWEFTWIEDADLEAKTEFEGAKLSSSTIIENIDEIGLCWDSLGKIFGRDWSNTLVVIDELELGLNHVSTSSTCRDRRSFILHTLEHKLRECLDNGGLVVVADADLSDVSLDYLTKIAPGHPPFIVGHDFKGDPWEVDFFTGKRDVILSQIDEWLAEENCRPIAVALDNQKEAESLSNVLTRKYPWLGKEVGGLVRIDSKITQTDFGKDFVKRPNESIQKYQPKILVYTPSLGVGCSIDLPYFAHIFGLFFGNLEPSQARQMLARVRQAVPRTVWANSRAGNSENESSSYLPEEIKRRMFDYNNTATTLIDLAVTLAKERTQDSKSDKDLLPNLIAVLQEMMGENGTWNNPHIDLYCKQIARRNFSLSQLAIQLRQELIDEGHHIRDVVADDKTSVGEAVRAGKEEINRQNATLTATAQNISFEQAQEIKRKSTRSTEEEHQATKAFLQHDLPEVDLTPDFVFKAKYDDNGRWLTQSKLFWHVYNLDALKDKDEREWRHRLNQFSKSVAFLPDVKTDTPKIEAIVKSGVLDWIKPEDLETEYSNQSPEGKAFIVRCYRNRKLIKTALNITIQKNSEPIKLANRILDRVGLGLAYTRKEKSSGNVVRYYKLDEELAMDSDRQAVWEALNQRWQERVVKIAESKSQQGLDRGQIENNILYKNNPSVFDNQPVESNQNYVVGYTTDEWLKLETLAEKLRAVHSWAQVDLTQEQLNEAWQFLALDDQQRLHQLYQQWQDQEAMQQEAIATVPTESEGDSQIKDLQIVQDSSQVKSKVSKLNTEMESSIAQEIVSQIDLEIQKNEPNFNPDNSPHTWARRLNKALLLGDHLAQQVYNLLPQQIIDLVWNSLALGVQKKYYEIFA